MQNQGLEILSRGRSDTNLSIPNKLEHDVGDLGIELGALVRFKLADNAISVEPLSVYAVSIHRVE